MDQSILLIDDEEGIRKVLGIYLSDMGYQVFLAENGEQGSRIFRKEKPPIVLVDIKMPGMDGIELLRIIKEEIPDTEVIMITGHGDMDLAIKSLKLEATDFVTKPINDDVLEIALKRAHERLTMRRLLREHTNNLEQLVRDKTKKLVEAEKLAAVGQTVAGLSHAIKNIASGLKGGAFVLEKGLELDSRKYLMQGWEMVKGNVDKITKLSMDLLNYAKVTDVNYKLSEPNQQVHEVVSVMQHQAKELGIHLKIELAPDLKAFYFDPELIHWCLLNLVSNAIDACMEDDLDNNGKVVLVKTVKAKGWGVEFQVIDNCCGMDEEIKENIFQGFYSTKGTKGTGIGLMITKKIVDGHKGVIEVESKKSVGSTFIIRLPEKLQP
ncbi:MAG: hybrid sensor histidine kinase/response regulator [Desulfobacterales bacterium]|nr:MAG: hybrid sensor histidine kinase/response regulator [Desulfobacterales bacterium]